MTVNSVSGVSVFGEQVLLIASLPEPSYVAVYMPGVVSVAGPRFGWLYLYSYSTIPGRQFVWRSQALTGQGTIFNIAGRPPTSNAQHALVCDWKRAGFPYILEYLT